MSTKNEKQSSEEEYEIFPLDDNTQFFLTFDLGLSAALVSVGFPLVSLDRETQNKVQFVFRRGDGMDEAINSYWADHLTVKARSYFDTLKMLKNRLYSE